MLSRTADHLFWMSRYSERAENLARLLDVTWQMSLVPQSAAAANQSWAAIIALNSLDTAYAKKYDTVNGDNVLRFMVSDDKALEGAFKTPGLRNVSLRAPYMHAGQFASLEEVVAHYVKAPPAAVGHTELAHGAPGHTERQPIELSASEARDLVAFLRTLAESAPPPR